MATCTVGKMTRSTNWSKCPSWVLEMTSLDGATALFCGLTKDSGVACWGDYSPVAGFSKSGTLWPQPAVSVRIASDDSDVEACAVYESGGIACWGWETSPIHPDWLDQGWYDDFSTVPVHSDRVYRATAVSADSYLVGTIDGRVLRYFNRYSSRAEVVVVLR